MATLNTNIQNSCFSVLDTIRSSNLNYSIQETPYSIFLTLRKSLIKSPNLPVPGVRSSTQQLVQDTTLVSNLQEENLSLKRRCQFLENSNEVLKNNLEEAIIDSEITRKTIHDLEDEHETMNKKLDKTEKEVENAIARKIKPVIEEKRSLQSKHEKICAEYKALRVEKEELCKEISHFKVALKTSRKETKDVVKNYEKKISDFEIELKDLVDYKISKTSEEKDLKIKVKRVDKRLKAIQEKEAKLELEKNECRNQSKKEKDLKSNLTTDYSEENSITEINVPIFNQFTMLSKLCESDSSSSISSQAIPSCSSLSMADFNSNYQVFPSSVAIPSSPQPPVSPFQIISQEKEQIDLKVASFVKLISEYFKAEPGDKVNDTIVKLESLKNLLRDESQCALFDDLIQEAKVYLDATENLKTADCGETEDFEYEDMPDYYWAQEYEVEE